MGVLVGVESQEQDYLVSESWQQSAQVHQEGEENSTYRKINKDAATSLTHYI